MFILMFLIGIATIVLIRYEYTYATQLRSLDAPSLYHSGTNGAAMILFHGLTASPEEVRPLLDQYAKANYTVYAPVLQGHGKSPEALRDVRWQDWMYDAERVYTEATQHHDHVFVGGVSLGAGLALVLASHHDDIEGVIAIAAPIVLKNKHTYLSRFLTSVVPLVDHPVEPGEETVYYTEVPPGAVAELIAFIAQLKRTLPSIHQPLVLFQSEQDPTVEPESARYIMEHIGSSERVLKGFNISSHVLIENEETANLIAGYALNFTSSLMSH